MNQKDNEFSKQGMSKVVSKFGNKLEEGKEKKQIVKKILITILLIVVALVSIFGVSKVATSEDTYAKTIKYLDEKKITVSEMSALSIGAATGIAMAPGDWTTPLANRIMDLSSYFIIIIGVIVLEKILITLLGYAVCNILIPLGCILGIMYVLIMNERLKAFTLKWIIKIACLSIVMITIVPISVNLSGYIEDKYSHTINQTLEQAKEIGKEVSEEEAKDKEEGVWDKITNGISNAVTAVGEGFSNLLERAELLLNNFIDSIAILIITTCAIPILVLLILLKLVNMIFDIAIPVRVPKLNMPKFREKKEKDVLE